MNARAKSLAIGISLVVALFVGMLCLLANWHFQRAYRHVVVEVLAVNDVARISVNCQRAAAVHSVEGKKTVDLGWMSPDDRISLSVFNEIGDSAWDLRIVSNGETVFERRRGHVEAGGFPADEYAVVMAKSFTADGDLLGTMGCDPPLVVSPALAGYQKSPDDVNVKQEDGVRAPWDRRAFPFSWIEAIAAWALPALALIGCAIAAATAEIREWIRRHWKISLLIAGASLLLNLLRAFGWEGLTLFAEISGLALLLLSAAIHIWRGVTGAPRLSFPSGH